MNTKYKVFNWGFNAPLWRQVIEDAIKDIGASDFAEIVGVDVKTLNTWSRHTGKEGAHPWPAMHNFLKVANALDLDPSEFFILEDI